MDISGGAAAATVVPLVSSSVAVYDQMNIQPQDSQLLSALKQTCPQLFAADTLNNILHLAKESTYTVHTLQRFGPLLDLSLFQALAGDAEDEARRIADIQLSAYLRAAASIHGGNAVSMKERLVKLLRMRLSVPDRKGPGASAARITARTSYADGHACAGGGAATSYADIQNVLATSIRLSSHTQNTFRYRFQRMESPVQVPGPVLSRVIQDTLLLERMICDNAKQKGIEIRPYLPCNT